MKPNLMLVIASLLSIFFMTLHFTSDTIHARVGTPEAGGSTLIAVPILVVWLYGKIELANYLASTGKRHAKRYPNPAKTEGNDQNSTRYTHASRIWRKS